MATEPSEPAPVGLQIFAVFAASAGGFSAGLLTNPRPLALLAGAFACLALFLLARLTADVEFSPVRSVLLLAAWAFTAALLLVALGEAVRPRRIRHDVVSTVGAVVRLIGVMAVALLAPSAAVAAGIRRAPSTGPEPAAGTPAGAGLTLPLMAAAVIATMLFLALAMSIREPAWRLAALFALVVVSPAAIMPLGALVYRVVLSRRAIGAPPALDEALARLAERTHVSFGRVLCLDAAYGSGRVCMVIGVPGCPTLAVSAALVEALPPAQFFALLAHEAAHVRFRHTARRLRWSVLLTVAALAAGIATLGLVDPLFPERFRLVESLVALFPVLLLRELYEAFVSRRHEADADRFAVRIAGADALLAGLERLRGTATELAVHNRWTTHGTWAARTARIREFEAQAAAVTSPA